jgi:hypothetical protein
MKPARRHFLLTGLVATAGLVITGAGCSSGTIRSSATTESPATLPSTTTGSMSATQTTVAGQLPTVPNCGGGAYKPQTLLIVCGVGATMATGVEWSSWTSTAAAGTGDVHLTTGGKQVSGQADLRLSDVRVGASGPQFTLLTVAWTGMSPDGRPTETFPLTE